MELTLYVLVIIITTIRYSNAVNYEIIFEDENFFTECDKRDGEGNVRLSSILDFGRVKHWYGEDVETVYSNGDIIVKDTIPKDQPISVSLDLYQWSRGQWVDTVITVRRDDFCKALFGDDMADKAWTGAIGSLPEMRLKCPPTKGTIYSLRNTTNRILLPNLPATEVAGRYKAVVRIQWSHFSSCVTLPLNIYRL